MDEAKAVAAECEQLSGSPALALHCNVADPASVDAAVAAIVAAWGGLHVLVASAGIYTGQPLTEVPLEGLAAHHRHRPDRRLPHQPGGGRQS